MSNEKKDLKLYTPKEVADMFGITTASLRSRRARGQIEAVVLNDNNVVYTEEQIRKANLSQRKRGPKPKKEKVEQDEGTTNAA
jgi:DNA-binding transcriptional MerR regulator